jgi:integrase
VISHAIALPERLMLSKGTSLSYSTRSGAIRLRHYRISTAEAYVSWIKRLILFHGKRHPLEMGKDESTRFLSALAGQRQVSASTPHQALCALIFLYHHVLDQNPGWLEDMVRAKRPPRLPVVLTRPEGKTLLGAIEGGPASWPAYCMGLAYASWSVWDSE